MKIYHGDEGEDRYKRGTLFWCSEGCGFVDQYHRCEQWSTLIVVPPALVRAIQNRKRASK